MTHLQGCSGVQRWPESVFQTPTPLLFQYFGIRVRIRARQFFELENPTPVQTPATVINATLIYPCFYLRNDHTNSCHCRNWKVTPDPDPVFPKFLTPGPDLGLKEKRRILPESTPVVRSRLRQDSLRNERKDELSIVQRCRQMNWWVVVQRVQMDVSG